MTTEEGRRFKKIAFFLQKTQSEYKMKLCFLLCLVLLPIVYTYSIANSQPDSNLTSVQKYGIKEGQWVKYGPLKIDVDSDNSYLELVMKGMIFKKNSSVPSPAGSLNPRSIVDMDWMLVNITHIKNDEITAKVTIKPKFTHDNSTYFSTGYTSKYNQNMFSFSLPKNPKVGDIVSIDISNESIPLTINDTTQRKFGNRSVDGYDAIATTNTYNETYGAAAETVIRVFFDKLSGRPLEISMNVEAGIFFATVKIGAKISAINWSN